MLTALAAGLVGSFALMKRMSLAGDVVSHIALPGLGVAMLLKVNPLVGAAIALLLGTVLIWQLQNRATMTTDVAIGVIFTAALAIGTVLTPSEDLIEALFGGFEGLTLIWFVIGLLAVTAIVLFVLAFRYQLILSLFSPELAAATGVNVSRLNLYFLLVFSLPKLVFDDEMCGQALHFVRDVAPADDLPTQELLEQLMADQHLIMAPHTSAHWPDALYLPSAIVERDNRENWTKAGAPDTYQRAVAETDRRLAAYRQIETDPAIVAELERIIRAGLTEQTELPVIPPPPDASEPIATGPSRRNNPRRQRKQEGPSA